MNLARVLFALLTALCLLGTPAGALTLGQVDTFEDGTVQGWVAAVLGQPHPQPPENVPSGGPSGVDDNYLRITSFGGQGAGSRLVAINLSQWAGNYNSTGVGAIEMDLMNLGQTDLFIRVLLEDPMGGPPANIAITSALFLPAGGGWTHATFSLDPMQLTALEGDVDTVLANATALRIFSSETPTFPPDPIVAQLGVDNIEAVSGPTPAEPASWGRVKGLFR